MASKVNFEVMGLDLRLGLARPSPFLWVIHSLRSTLPPASTLSLEAISALASKKVGYHSVPMGSRDFFSEDDLISLHPLVSAGVATSC
jgi:hypothetical protein